MMIPLSAPDIGDREIAYVTDVLRSRHLSLGPRLAQFEERFAEYIGTRYAVAANSGTSALHLCVRALGIEAGDEAITTSFSFVASVNCLLYEGAAPCFVDIDARTLNLNPQAVREFLHRQCKRTAKGILINKATGRRIKAILPVHVFGMPSDMTALVQLAREYGLSILEDACEAIGAECNGQRVGSFGNAGVFAFYPNKQMTTGEGGMIVTDDPKLADLCRSLRNQGRDTQGRWLKHVRLGYNYRMSDIHAALGLAQLERIEEILVARGKVARLYSEVLSGCDSLLLPIEESGMKRSWFVYVVQLPTRELRDQLMASLQSKHIGCQVYFPAIHRQPYFRQVCGGPIPVLPNTDQASDRCLALPFSSQLSSAEIRLVCDEIVSSLEGRGRDLLADRPQSRVISGVAARG
jgi:dTDP-4-amino-4,6-dideoxygalactose transaminase